MSNILALAQKELRAYFVSPMAYALFGFFALLFGYFYVANMNVMLQYSMGQFGQGGPQIVNINEFMIRPLFGNTAIILLMMLPFLTARAYAEEKRSGTMELLLTSPISDVQIIIGKFLGAMALYTMMLGITLVHIGILFWYGDPEWGPIVSGYLGLLLMGGSFISVGLAKDAVLSYLSILEHFDDFSKGVIDTSHVTYYVSLIAFGLFLTAKSLDTARWNG